MFIKIDMQYANLHTISLLVSYPRSDVLFHFGICS
jgi:hypothetical protein